jgi:hypothetical protein
MTEFKSNPVLINAKDRELFSFLTDFNNIEKMMPEQVVDWKSSADSCSFTIQGMADMALTMGYTREFSLVRFNSSDPSPFDFTLQFAIEKQHTGSLVTCSVTATLSPMIKLMLSRPLQNFVNLLIEKLKQETESGFGLK